MKNRHGKWIFKCLNQRYYKFVLVVVIFWHWKWWVLQVAGIFVYCFVVIWWAIPSNAGLKRYVSIDDALFLTIFPTEPILLLSKSLMLCSYLFPIKSIQRLWKSLMYWCFVPTYFLLNPLNVFGKVYYVIRLLNFLKLRSGKHAQHWYRLSYPQ